MYQIKTLKHKNNIDSVIQDLGPLCNEQIQRRADHQTTPPPPELKIKEHSPIPSQKSQLFAENVFSLLIFFLNLTNSKHLRFKFLI
jgi:hypothetical protein